MYDETSQISEQENRNNFSPTHLIIFLSLIDYFPCIADLSVQVQQLEVENNAWINCVFIESFVLSGIVQK